MGPAARRWISSPATASGRRWPSASVFSACRRFSARVTVDRRPGGQVVVEGRLRGKIVQACVLTLDPVTQDLDDTFRIVFKKDLAEERDPESGEAVLSAQADAPEPLSGNMLDVGEIVAEQLSLAADPYPRRPGVEAGGRPAQAPGRRPRGARPSSAGIPLPGWRRSETSPAAAAKLLRR